MFIRCLALAAVAVCALPAGASAEQVIVESFDGTKIVGDFQPAAGLRPGERAPTILMTHGWGGTRGSVEGGGALTDAVANVGASVFRSKGYNTLTYDSRGFGDSGGTAQVDSPNFEGRDASALIDYVATRPEAQLDSAGDPRLGMHGASYGGGVQLATASRDRRVDTIVPSIAWNSLIDSLSREGVAKFGWGALLLGIGVPTSTTLGAFAPQGIELGNLDPALYQAAVDGIAAGRFSPAVDDYLRSRGTGEAVRDIRVPTLILQGTFDTLFSLSQGMKNYERLRGSGAPLKMVWFCGGHGACATGNSSARGLVEKRVVAWMDRYLRGRDADVGPRFEWVADDDRLRSAADFPLKPLEPLRARGTGSLALTPVGTLNGLLIAGTAAANAVNVPIPAPAQPSDIVGEPVLKLRYRGQAGPVQTHVYAQLVDDVRNVVVDGQVTPIPVVLDGQAREVERPLEGVAMRAGPGSRYRLQIIEGTNLYGVTRTAGSIDVDATISLPVGDAAGTPPGVVCSRAGSAVLRIDRAAGRSLRLRGRRVTVAGRAVRLGARQRRLRIALHPSRAGTRVVVRVRGRTKAGRIVRRSRTFEVCPA